MATYPTGKKRPIKKIKKSRTATARGNFTGDGLGSDSPKRRGATFGAQGGATSPKKHLIEGRSGNAVPGSKRTTSSSSGATGAKKAPPAWGARAQGKLPGGGRGNMTPKAAGSGAAAKPRGNFKPTPTASSGIAPRKRPSIAPAGSPRSSAATTRLPSSVKRVPPTGGTGAMPKPRPMSAGGRPAGSRVTPGPRASGGTPRMTSGQGMAVKPKRQRLG